SLHCSPSNGALERWRRGPRGGPPSFARARSDRKPLHDSPMPGSEPERRAVSTAAELGRHAGLGLQFAASLSLFGAIGWWLDRRLSTAPWLLIVGLFLGAALAFVSLLHAVPPGRG